MYFTVCKPFFSLLIKRLEKVKKVQGDDKKMLLSIAGIMVFIFFFIIPFLAPHFFAYLLLFSGAMSLSFLGGGRAFLSSVGGINADALKLLSTLLGGLIILGTNRNFIPLLAKFKFHIFFLFYCLISLVWCDDLIFGLRTFAKLLAPLLLLLIFMSSLTTQKRIEKADKWIFGGGILVILISLVASILGFDFSGGGHHIVSRFTVPFSNASPFSFYMLTLSLYSLSSFYYERRKQYLFLFFLFSFFCCLPLTRITIGSFFVSLTIFFFLTSRKKIIVMLISVFFFFVTLYAFTTIDILKKRTFFNLERVSFMSVLENPVDLLDNLNTSGRTNLWSLSLEKFFWQNPIIGSGIGSTQNYFYGSRNKKKIGIMHSEYVRLLCETGIIGCVMFVGAFSLYLIRMYILWRNAKSILAQKYALTSILCLTSYLIISLTDNAIESIFYLSMYIFAYMAFAFQLYEQESRDVDSAI